MKSIDEIRFPQAIVDFGDIISWANLCEYQWKFNEDGTSDLFWERKDPITIQLKDDLRISFCASQGKINVGVQKTEVKATQHINVYFKYNHPVLWETILEDIKNVRYLIGFGMNQNVETESIKYAHETMIFDMGSSAEGTSKIYNNAPITLGVGKFHHIEPQQINEYLYSLPQIIANDVVIKWCKIEKISNYYSLCATLEIKRS